ncbi:OmpA family protein [Vibrio sp. 1S139]|uniref:OmpA family protein n=1 Tax=Vibrio sp. 1S139 TaxID=3230006 RepID=UPI00352BD3D8
MNYKQIIFFAVSIFVLSPALAQEAPQVDEPEKDVIDTLVSNGLYFQVGGGFAQFKGDPYKHDNDITSLRYSLGITTQPLNYEIGYRSLSDGNRFEMKGLDVLAKHQWSLWRDGGLFAGVGGYIYNADMDKPQFNSPTESSGVAPYLSIGGYYSLSEYIDISLQLDNLFNVSVPEQDYNKKDTKQLRQVNLSLVLHPWSSTRNIPQPIEHIEDEPEELELEDRLSYSYDDYSLDSENKEQLIALVDRIVVLDSYEIVVTGSADSKADYLKYNTRLAKKRAQNVINFLVFHGVQEASISMETSITELLSTEGGKEDARTVKIYVVGFEKINN